MLSYLDHAASSPIRPEALDAMQRVMLERFGNPSGAHRVARAANRELDEARETMARHLGVRPGEVVFTSGGTEADNLAISGVLDLNDGEAVCSAIEHHAVLDIVAFRGGRTVTVNAAGQIDLDDLERQLGPNVGLVSIMLANNETGVVQPLSAAIELVRRLAPNAVVHTDAVQAFCWLDLTEAAAEADLITISAHKFGGPQGVGALAVRGDIDLAPLLRGGGQERERRSGTQNVAGVVAMAAAAEVTVAERPSTVKRVAALRDQLVEGLTSDVDGVYESGVIDASGVVVAPDEAQPRGHKTPNIAHLCFAGIESEALLFLIEQDGVMASAAASCSSGALEPSHVLAAMGYPRDLAAGSLRLSLAHSTTEDDVAAAIAAIGPAVRRLRGASVSAGPQGGAQEPSGQVSRNPEQVG